ncbi:MAG: valine--tRNA ligase [Xanthobacteraceae bacterium]
MTIDKTYQPAAVEGRIYAAWEAAGAFRAGRPERAKAVPYCIVIPPPNVTGSLHMGHALNNTLQDILCRFERMRGKDVLWQPGTDHAGIATQAVVERQLMERQEPGSREMGREAFIKRVWEWKAESGGAIIGQLKRLGASCDWSRERFTMDEGLSRAVVKVFVQLYDEKLIYRDKRLVNWDPMLKTAISDLEVQQVETRGSLWYIRYPILDESNRFVTVATTRPETMLGDMAVAVHPDDERYRDLIGKEVLLPLANRPIAIIADEYSDPEKGTGAVKITPAHDFNDFEVWKRYVARISDTDRRRFEDEVNYRSVDDLINIFTPEAKLKSSARDDHEATKRAAWPMPEHIRDFNRQLRDTNLENDSLSAGLEDFNLIPQEFRGLDRFEARKKIVERLEACGLLEKIEPTTHSVPRGDRSGAVIEPFLTDQWYVDAKTLAQPAIEAVRQSRTNFVPVQWEATFFNWMENIQPWCISRQIWWGHQIPVWYGPEGEIFAASSEAEAVTEAISFYESKGRRYETDLMPLDGIEYAHGLRSGRYKLHRDEDVLDTWFSSALWPFSTLGWPDQTPDMKRYYPTSVLVTGFDIIFFWVARMMMMGLHFMKEVPFPTVYIHALVRDAAGAKMSKSKGNVIDPLEVIDEYGADALRFTLAAMAAQGRDIKLSSERVAGYRNFATKLWNAARFAEINGCATIEGFDPRAVKEILNRWIAHETAKTAAEITEAIAVYRFNDAAAAAYRFVWNIYCDWYLELAKPLLTGPDGAGKDETRAMVAWARDEILKLLHPFMPFITEELWAVAASTERESLLALSEWPSLEGIGDAKAEAEIGWVIDLITSIRSVRAEMNVNVPLPLVMVRVGDHVWDRAQRWSEFIKRMAKISEVNRAPAHQQGAVQLVVRGEVVELPLAGVIDLAAERARLAKEMAKCDADIARVEQKLGNADFLKRAPEDVVEGEREKREAAQERKAKIAEALERLKGAA